MPRMRSLVLLAAMLAVSSVRAGEIRLEPETIIETKAVFGRIEARDVIAARPRIGGTLVSVSVSEGDLVREGQSIARVIDDKLALQLRAAEARIKALVSEQANVQAEFERAKTLLERGAGTQQRVDTLRTQLEVVKNQIAAAEADRSVIVQQSAEGEVFAPVSGRVLKVPVTRGAVVMPGEQIALVAGGGFFLRLALPERHATNLRVGSTVALSTERGGPEKGKLNAGKLAKVFPQIENGRVIADVELGTLDDFFVGARVLAEVPVGERQALMVPKAALKLVSGIDLVAVATESGARDVTVVPGREAGGKVEILSGLKAGDKVIVP